MDNFFADRIVSVPPSFIREILKVSLNPEIISFAGGLPNKEYFPVEAISEAARQVLSEVGADALQYSSSEGFGPLRELIAARYEKQHGFLVSPDQILITNGSQQALDLLGKVLLNEGDRVLIEEPGYLGAIQSLSIYRPEFAPVAVNEAGIDFESLNEKSQQGGAKMLYTVPTFQNPSGISYDENTRKQLAEMAQENGFLIVEDDPYGELRFSGTETKPIYSYAPERTILLGSFSKTVAPGFRLGWLVAPEGIYNKLLVAKQASDLHTSTINQHIMARFLSDNDLDLHIERIRDAYGRNCKTMLAAARKFLPSSIQLWEPQGGMFFWGELPEGVSADNVFNRAVEEKVVFVPGRAFYTQNGGERTLRLNYSCAGSEEIDEGMRRLAKAFDAVMS